MISKGLNDLDSDIVDNQSHVLNEDTSSTLTQPSQGNNNNNSQAPICTNRNISTSTSTADLSPSNNDKSISAISKDDASRRFIPTTTVDPRRFKHGSTNTTSTLNVPHTSTTNDTSIQSTAINDNLPQSSGNPLPTAESVTNVTSLDVSSLV